MTLGSNAPSRKKFGRRAQRHSNAIDRQCVLDGGSRLLAIISHHTPIQALQADAVDRIGLDNQVKITSAAGADLAKVKYGPGSL